MLRRDHNSSATHPCRLYWLLLGLRPRARHSEAWKSWGSNEGTGIAEPRLRARDRDLNGGGKARLLSRFYLATNSDKSSDQPYPCGVKVGTNQQTPCPNEDYCHVRPYEPLAHHHA